MKRIILLGATIALLSANCVHGQVPSAARVVADMENTKVERLGGFETARMILEQRTGHRPAAVLDSVADGLVAVARRPVITARDRWTNSDAVTALELAGSSRARVPYAKALDRLKNIYELAADAGTKGATLQAIGGLADTTAALEFLSGVSQEKSAYAYFAAAAIAERLGEPGKARLIALNKAGKLHEYEIVVLVNRLQNGNL
jgi:hypothetical protein